MTGTSHAARLLVSLLSLRRHYKGPVTVVTPRGDHFLDVVNLFVDEPRLGVTAEVLPFGAVPGRWGFYATKALAAGRTPYHETLFLDADTVVAGPVDPLFGGLGDGPGNARLNLTGWKDVHTQLPSVRGRLERMRHAFPALVDREVAAPRPAVNTGVFAYWKDVGFLEEWAWMCETCPVFVADELAMQLLHRQTRYRLLGDAYNYSPVHGPKHLPPGQAVVWHGHGGSHLVGPMAAQWGWWLSLACQMGILDVQEWANRADEALGAFLHIARWRPSQGPWWARLPGHQTFSDFPDDTKPAIG